jgi:putative addiction module component (TIGR02574 family)
MNINDPSLEERLQLVEDIWDSITAEQDVLSLTSKQREELDRRLEAYRIDRNRGASAVESMERIRSRP